MPKRSTWEQSHPECAAATREAVEAVRAEYEARISKLEDELAFQSKNAADAHQERSVQFRRAADARDLLQQIVDAYGLGITHEAFVRHIEEPIEAARKLLAE